MGDELEMKIYVEHSGICRGFLVNWIEYVEVYEVLQIFSPSQVLKSYNLKFKVPKEPCFLTGQ